ncbi:hypothetical protein ACM46_15740 [Chryseobacterium angstadtii]|uniref:Uncharacterized protein n=1 Tax=Chryseobacterium angstadtii TaxID=558151 RepID=A0A0J7I503_9FLAO|nr:hypothetical protein [Chryseobacterium angstadtii]KMQ61468.1 hypothetical protein ACM46_15740 [Chryseobacterium angstadtii]
MPIVRRFEQNKKTLEQFYKELIPKPDDQIADFGTPMLEVLKSVNTMFQETVLYGLTSHASLLLFSDNHENSDYYVIINAYQLNSYAEYRIDYVIPENIRPWEGAIVNGSSGTLDEFEKKIIISMYNSEGWKHNIELQNLYESIK